MKHSKVMSAPNAAPADPAAPFGCIRPADPRIVVVPARVTRPTTCRCCSPGFCRSALAVRRLRADRRRRRQPRRDPAALARASLASGVVHLLRLSRNFGKEAAMTAGLDHADGDVVLTMDADGSTRPSCCGHAASDWREGADMVYAVRARAHRRGPAQAGWAAPRSTALMRAQRHVDMPPDAGDFRLLDRGGRGAAPACPSAPQDEGACTPGSASRARPSPTRRRPPAAAQTSFGQRGCRGWP